MKPPRLPVDKWPWYWTYAHFLEKRWENIQEISGMYGDEDQPEGNDFREIPKSIWPNKKLVDEWVEAAKRRRKDKLNGDA